VLILLEGWRQLLRPATASASADRRIPDAPERRGS
jgi:hypothetical protein